MNNNLVFNTLVFQAKINSGLKQVELFDDILSLGFNKIEPRREYFIDIDKEIPEMRKAAESKNITLFYSCLLYTSPSPRDLSTSRMPSSA